MNPMEYENIVRLKILSDTLIPEEITEILGIFCDRSWRTGDFRPQTTIKEKTNGWVLDSGLPLSSDLDTMLENFLKRLAPYSEKIRTLSLYNTVYLSCVIYCSASPPTCFSNAIVSAIAELGADFNLDMILLPRDDEELQPTSKMGPKERMAYYKSLRLWNVLEKEIEKLIANRDLELTTAQDIVVGSIIGAIESSLKQT